MSHENYLSITKVLAVISIYSPRILHVDFKENVSLQESALRKESQMLE
jgi:hypothetical protein